MYCGSCLHANALAKSVQQQGHEILMVPFYTPVRTDDENMSDAHIAYTGVNVFLQQKWAFFRRPFRLLDRLFDSPWLFRLLGRWSDLTDPAKLGPLTVSMLQGEEGAQKKELEKLITWLKSEVKPEVVHLSNVMLVGMARRIRRELDVPVLCSLTGEDLFLEQLPQPHRRQAREVLQERTRELDGLIALNRYYADFMASYLNGSPSRIHVIPPGIAASSVQQQESEVEKDCRKTIGFFSRVCHEKGLHDLVEAWLELNENQDPPPADLKVGGYLSRSQWRYLRELETEISRKRLGDHFEYVGEPTLVEKWEFLASLDLMCLPCQYPESKGLPVLESLACGTPVVLPEHGVFPELVEKTGGGRLYPPGNREKLVETLRHMLTHPQETADLGVRGKASVLEDFTLEQMARKTIELYQKLLLAS